MKIKYKMQSWKLGVWGEYDSEDEAIKTLADLYMSCSKCDPPSESFPETLAQYTNEIQIERMNAINAECLLDAIGGKTPVPEVGVSISPNTIRTENDIAKSVAFYVEEEIHGIKQWVLKYVLAIYPFKPEHWWKSEKGFIPQNKDFKYKIKNQ